MLVTSLNAYFSIVCLLHVVYVLLSGDGCVGLIVVVWVWRLCVLRVFI